MSGPGGHHRRRRLVATVGVVGLLAAIGAPSALADTGLGSLVETTEQVTSTLPAVDGATPVVETAVDTAAKTTEPVLDTVEPAVKGTPADNVEETVGSVVEPARNVVDTTTQTVTKTATDAVNDPVGTVTKVVNDPVGTVGETVAPVVQTVQESTEETLGAVTTSTQRTLGSATTSVEPVTTGLGVSNILGHAATAAGETVRDTTGAALGAPASVAEPGTPAPADTTVFVDAPRVIAQRGAAQPAVAPPTLPKADKDSAMPGRGPSEPATTFSSAPAVGVAHVAPADGAALPSSQPQAPLPDFPSGPLTALFSASASVGGGALAFLLAVLAAATLLAAPGLGRRLRPTLAPWPQPILQISLERPG